MAEQSAYTVLNVRKGASEHEIKLAYVELVKRYDPDVHTEMFMRVQSAYDRLRDPRRRAVEDLASYNQPRGEFMFSAEEQTSEDTLEQLTAEINTLEPQAAQNPDVRSALVLALMRRSRRLTQKKQWMDAIKDWSILLRYDPTHQRAKNNLLFSYIYLGYYYAVHELHDEAIQLWERLIQMWPDNVDVIQNLALATEKSGDRAKAGQYWSETIKIWKGQLEKSPDDEYLKALLVEAHKHHGGKTLENVPTAETKQEAIENYREVLKINPSDFEAQFSIASALMEERKYDEAAEELKRLQQQHPKNIDIINTLGWAYLNSGKFELAFNTWRRGQMIDPKSHTIKDSIIRARLAVGKKLKEGSLYTQALVHFKELQKMMPNQWELHYEIADTLMRKGDKRTAMAEFQKVLDLDPKNKLARKALSDLRLR